MLRCCLGTLFITLHCYTLIVSWFSGRFFCSLMSVPPYSDLIFARSAQWNSFSHGVMEHWTCIFTSWCPVVPRLDLDGSMMDQWWINDGSWPLGFRPMTRAAIIDRIWYGCPMFSNVDKHCHEYRPGPMKMLTPIQLDTLGESMVQTQSETGQIPVCS